MAGLRNIDLGEAQNYHMYGLFKKIDKNMKNTPSIVTSYNEIKSVIQKYKLKIELKEFLKSIKIFK